MIDLEEEIEEITTSHALKGCSQACVDNQVECPFGECEHWISFGQDNNCDLISIQKHGTLTLREIGERMGISYVRVKQIEDAAIKKIRSNTPLVDCGDYL